MGKRRSGRKGYKPIEGAEHRIHRRRKNDSTTEWTRAAKAGKGTEYDSLCHRYLREIGAFRRDDDASLAANAAASVSAVAASGAAASTARDQGSKKALCGASRQATARAAAGEKTSPTVVRGVMCFFL